MFIYILYILCMSYAYLYISKYICTHVYTRTHTHTQRSVVETYDTERRNLARAHGGSRDTSGFLTSICLSYIFVYVPTLVYSGVACRPREEARRDISPNARSRDDLEAES